MASPRPSPPCCARRRRVGLAEALEDVGQELGRDADARCRRRAVARRSSRAAARPSTRPPCGVNFTAFESRFQTTCCSRPASPDHRARRRDRAPSTRDRPWPRAAGRIVSTADVDDRARDRRGATSRRSLPEMMRDTSSRSSIELRLRARVALDDLERALERSCGERARVRSMLRPAEDRVQRRAQLVRDRRRGTRPSAVRFLLAAQQIDPLALPRSTWPTMSLNASTSSPTSSSPSLTARSE